MNLRNENNEKIFEAFEKIDNAIQIIENQRQDIQTLRDKLAEFETTDSSLYVEISQNSMLGKRNSEQKNLTFCIKKQQQP